ncbi:MAG: penicillin-binding protein 2 [Microbacteriaceae bacterium]|nr:penicillin-binding protein 2 [Microbacteriaceae bacterium]
MSYMQPGDTSKRIRIFTAILVVVSLVFTWKLVEFQVVRAAEINKISKEKRSVTRTIPAVRGSILDSAGNVLARTVNRYDINAAPINVLPITRTVNGQSMTISVEQQIAEIAAVLGLTVEDVTAKVAGKSNYANIKKNVDSDGYRALQKLDIPWLYYDQKLARIYPDGAVAGNLLGFVGVDGTPLAGIERQYNSCLAGIDGQETFERGATDGIRIPNSAQVTQKARNGSDVVLTINADLQYYTQQVLVNTVRNLRADWASAVVVEVKTGNILAAAEAPTVDPNNPGGSAAADRASRIFQAVFEPGSTMKTVTAATVIDQGQATPESKIKAPYRIRLPWGQYIQDSHMHGTDKLTLTGVLRDSSNTGMIQFGARVNTETRYNYLRKFGVGEKTSVNFEGESAGLINKWQNWDKLTDKTSMFGQGIAVTPIQTAFFYQTVANGGVRLQPRLVAGCRDASGNVTASNSKPGVRVISQATARSTIDMLEKVVEQGGIGRTAAISGYRIAGKSGTAQIKDGKGYGYRYAISFIGMAPAENPEYVLAVTIYKPRTVSNSIGATPPFKRIFEQVLRTYRVPPSTTKSAKIATTW